MTPEQLRRLIEQTGQERKVLARLLGYSSDNSLRQCEAGDATLPTTKAEWLKGYARLRAKHAAAEAAWIEKNPLLTAK